MPDIRAIVNNYFFTYTHISSNYTNVKINSDFYDAFVTKTPVVLICIVVWVDDWKLFDYLGLANIETL